MVALNPEQALQKAITVCGGKTELARRLGIKAQSINDWPGRVPAERVIAVEKACENAVKRHELRPDIYPPEELATTEITDSDDRQKGEVA